MKFLLPRLVHRRYGGPMTTPNVERIPEFTIGDRLRKARELTGLDQGPFADEIGVSRGTVSNYEAGKTTAIKRLYLRTWAMRTGVPVEWLATGQVTRRPTPPEGELPRHDSNVQPAG